MEGAVELLGVAEAAERGLVDHGLAARGRGAVLLQEELAVLVGDEEAGGHRVHAQAVAVLGAEFNREPAGEVVDRGLGVRVTQHAGDRAIGGHRREIHDRSLLLVHQGLGENERREHRALQIQG